MSLLSIFNGDSSSDDSESSSVDLSGPLDTLANSVASSVASAVGNAINPPAQNAAPAPDLNKAAAQPTASTVAKVAAGVSPVLLLGGGALIYLVMKGRK